LSSCPAQWSSFSGQIEKCSDEADRRRKLVCAGRRRRARGEHYPNGDVTHCFALCFLATSWQEDPIPNEDEATDAGFFDPKAPPQPLHSPTAHTLKLLEAFHRSSTFQVR
jgi:hypothetical protein